MRQALIMTTAHSIEDTRVVGRQAVSISKVRPLVLFACHLDARASPFGLSTRIFPKKPGRAARLKSVVRFVRASRSEDPSIAHLHDPELFLAAPILQRLGHKVIVDLHEDYPKQLIHHPGVPRFLRRPATKLVTQLIRSAADAADHVIVASPEIAETLGTSSTVIYNYPPRHESGEPPSQAAYGARPTCVVSVGTNTVERAFLEIVDAAASLASERQIRSVIAGPIFRSTANEKADSVESALIQFPGRLDRTEVQSLLDEATVGLCLLHRSPQYEEARPTKLFEYMLAAIPIVGADFGPTAELIEQIGCGIAVDPTDAGAIARAVEYLHDNRDKAWEMGQRGRAAVTERWTWEVEEQKLQRVYDALELC